MAVVFLSAPYSADTHEGIEANIQAARKVAIELMEQGHAVFTPHLNCIHFEQDCACTYDQYLKADLAFLARCDCMVMLPGWEKSNGCNGEYDAALSKGIPVYFYPDVPPLSPTEVAYPEQCDDGGDAPVYHLSASPVF